MLSRLQKVTKGGVWIAILVVTICAFNYFSDYLTRAQLEVVSEKSDRITKSLAPSYIHEFGSTTPIHAVTAGKPFYVFNTYSRNDVCDYTVSVTVRSPMTMVGTVLRANNSWLPAGTIVFNDFLEVPSDFPPGDYVITKKFVNRCSNKIYYSTVFELPMTVVAPKVVG